MPRRPTEKDRPPFAKASASPEWSVAALTPPPDADPARPRDRDDAQHGSFIPGMVFAGRYRMIAPIGRGATSEVWRAEDLVVQTPVALKLIHATDERGRERLLGEVRLARQITHPAICRIFDAGEAEGRVFYSMELVEGEDLSTLLRRTGRLPSEKVLDVGAQLCDGLAAAHAHGILHGGLTPASILIDQDGFVRITDFGISTAGNEIDGACLAPEQRTPGTPASERTDLHAVGLVMYELLTGLPPVRAHASKPPARPSTIVPGLDPRLERAIMHALAADPKDRPVSAVAMIAELLNVSPAATKRRLRPWMAGMAIAVVVGLLAVLSSYVQPRGGHALTDRDTIVLAEFLNTTGDPVFDGALRVALAVSLEQSPFLKIFPDERVRDTLRLMEHPPDTRVTRSIARDVARREGLKALVAGSIATLGSHYVVSLEAINAETGDVMAREQADVAGKEQVLASLGEATSRLREQLGESLSSIRTFDAPLPRATTGSLEALHAYALALDEGRVNPRPEAIPHLMRAIELDPDFAMAQALMSGVYTNTGRSAEAPAFSRRAFDLRDRVSERERFFIAWRYYVDAAQAWDKALDLAQSWTTTYPREAFAFNSLAIASAAFGEHGRAVAGFQQAIGLDPGFRPPYGNLAGSLIALNRFDEAKALVRRERARGVNAESLHRVSFMLALVDQDTAAMARELTSVRGTSSARLASNWDAHAAAFAGRFGAADAALHDAVQAALRDNLPELGAQWSMEKAELQAIAGACDAARREVDEGLALARDNFTLERASRAMALCGDRARTTRLLDELTARFPDATLTARIQVPVTRAALALSESDPRKALEVLDPVAPYDHAPSAELWPAYLRGLARLGAKDGRGARAQFQGILDHRGESPASPLYPLARLGLARAAVMSGDLKAARDGYQRFFQQWKDADPNLVVMGEARREYTGIR